MKSFYNIGLHFPGKRGRIAVFTSATVMLPGRSTTFSQAINLNVELHSLAVFLSLPFDVTSKAKIKGFECGEGKSQALSLPACDIC